MTTTEYLETYKEYDNLTSDIQNHNRMLVEKYPFLLPRDSETDEIPSDYDFSYTLMDKFPAGWRVAFGEHFLEDIKVRLLLANCKLDDYRIYNVGVENGSLVWKDNSCSKDLNDVVRFYNELSRATCIFCGAPATSFSHNLPVCDNCI